MNLHWVRPFALVTLAMALLFPPPAAAQFEGAKAVSLETGDPNLTLRGALWTAEAPAKAAVVIIHGSGGWSEHREGHYGRALKNAGYTVLAVDSFGPRGITSTIDDQSKINSLTMLGDAFAARRYFRASGVPAERLAIMGFSKGGSVSLMAADRNYLPAEAERFALAVPFYPGCTLRPREPKPVSEVVMLLGEKDDYTGVKPCQTLASEFQAAGGKITVKIYPDATHGWDGHPARTALFRLPGAEVAIDCEVFYETDGRYGYGGKAYTEAEYGEMLNALRATCMKHGARMWTNLTQKQAATGDLIELLDKTFAAKP